ncbi:regulatory protein RecX [Actinomadura sp. 21ATH]|uniref:regulatory protein RecX n=1 Tax=Actinomadura sp. 21ATH TaxID=1735444 RepID=UPI0035BFD260
MTRENPWSTEDDPAPPVEDDPWSSLDAPPPPNPFATPWSRNAWTRENDEGREDDEGQENENEEDARTPAGTKAAEKPPTPWEQQNPWTQKPSPAPHDEASARDAGDAGETEVTGAIGAATEVIGATAAGEPDRVDGLPEQEDRKAGRRGSAGPGDGAARGAGRAAGGRKRRGRTGAKEAKEKERDGGSVRESPGDASSAAAGRRVRAGRGAGGGERADGAAAAEENAEGRAREICLRLLGMGPRTRAQLADALRRKGIPDEVAEGVLSRFTEVGLIDDEAFAQAWVQSRHSGRGLAKRALAAELRRRGVAQETVNDAVETLDSEEEERTARRLIERKAAATRGVDPAKRMRRLVGVLARKGYPPGLSYRVVRDVLAEEGTEVEEMPDPD